MIVSKKLSILQGSNNMNDFNFNSVRYASHNHKTNFIECCNTHLNTERVLDRETLPILYLISLVEEVQPDIRHQVYNFDKHLIKTECLKEPWQTNGTLKALRLAFNLWNGYTEEEKEVYSTPYEIFDNHWAPYFVEAIKLRFKNAFEPLPGFFKTVYDIKRRK